MIEKIIPDKISFTLPTVFGEELTFLEFCGRVRAKLNECIDVVNDKTATIDQFTARIDANAASINTVSGKVGKNTTDIQKNTADIQKNATAISANTTNIQKNATAISANTTNIQKNATAISANTTNIQKNATAISANTTNIQKNATAISANTTNIQKNATAISANQSSITALSGKVDKNTADIQQNTTDIQNNAKYINTIQQKVAENILDIQDHDAKIAKNTADIQQNTSAISANESSIEAINTAFNALRNNFLNKKVESLFAPVILNVESHESGADINASVYIRLGRIDWQGLGCLYAKVNLSFSGATDAKTLKINSIQFGDRKAADITSVSTSFTAKTNVFGIPISIVGTETLPVGTSDIAVTGINLLGMSIVSESLASSFALDSIPTGIDIPCESLTFTSPGGGESDPKIVYTLKIAEGDIDIYLTSGGQPLTTEQAILKVDFTDTISDSMIYDQFVCAGGVYNEDTISSISENGQVLGAALINHTGYTDNGHVYNARVIIRDADNSGTDTKLSIKSTGIATKKIPLGLFAHISLTFDMFN